MSNALVSSHIDSCYNLESDDWDPDSSIKDLNVCTAVCLDPHARPQPILVSDNILAVADDFEARIKVSSGSSDQFYVGPCGFVTSSYSGRRGAR